MKIGIDIRSIGKKRTGDETYTKNLVKNLLRIDQGDQYFLYTDVVGEEELRKIKNKIDPSNQFGNFEIVSITPSHKLLWTFFSLPKYLKKNPVDVLHVQYITPQFLSKGISLITTIHDVSFNVFPQHLRKSDLFFLKILIPLSLRKADKIIAVSNFTKEEIIKFYQTKEAKIKAVYNGGADKRFQNIGIDDETKLRVKEKYSLPDNFIFYVGTLQPRKNIPFLLEGFKKIKEGNLDNFEIKNVKLVIGGSQDGHNYDQKISEKLTEIKKSSKNVYNDIVFTGYIDENDLAGIYGMARAFCFPSLYEGFGLPLIEAMTTGIPVLCSDSSCHKEVAGAGAEYFKENDLDEFTKKLFDIILNKDKIKLLIEEGKKRACFFSWEKCAQETLEVCRSVAKKEIK